MPARDRTGPAGGGPMCGRGLGPCGGGMRRGFGRGFGSGMRFNAEGMTKDEKISALKEHLRCNKERRKELESQLGELNA